MCTKCMFFPFLLSAAEDGGRGVSLSLYLSTPKTMGVTAESDWREQDLLMTGLSTRQTTNSLEESKVRKSDSLFTCSVCPVDSLQKKNIRSMPQGMGKKGYSAINLIYSQTQFNHFRFLRYLWLSFYSQPCCSGFKHRLQNWIWLSQWEKTPVFPKQLVA